ncbi:MAG: RsmD family RNA methyltransferase [Synergistaceae bacterium]|jgi:16S rRNA (guanine(966)-N(2))-methyltransferase RsmD|nr:RsmD family RNA methyltransferase [Synergistaceae bacterium]
MNSGGSRNSGARSIKNVRPTSGKTRMALFNILQASGHINGGRFLDLFSGTGGVALAALERGAANVTAVELDRLLASRITSSIGRSGEEFRCVRGDVRRVVPKLARESGESGAFDVVFADPPYCMGWGEIMPRLMMEEGRPLLSAGGVFVLERSSRETPAEVSIRRDDRIYGETVLSFYWLDIEKRG